VWEEGEDRTPEILMRQFTSDFNILKAPEESWDVFTKRLFGVEFVCIGAVAF
jgi:hypothetical protein